jgi:hypothetical protein
MPEDRSYKSYRTYSGTVTSRSTASPGPPWVFSAGDSSVKRFLRLELFAVFLAGWLFGCMAFQFQPRTAFGVQCPTAEIQTVSVPIRDCCGKVVGYAQRAPEPGEATFTQCRCAERKTVTDFGLPPKLEPFFLPDHRFEMPDVPPPFDGEHPYVARAYRVDTPPFLRPPVAA